MVFKNLNENYRKIPDTKLWSPETIARLKQKGDEWIPITLDKNIKFIQQDINSLKDIQKILEDNWDTNSRNSILILESTGLSSEDIIATQHQYYSDLYSEGISWLNIYLSSEHRFLAPYEDIKMGIIQRIRERKKAKIIGQYKRGLRFESLITGIISPSLPLKDSEQFLKQMRAKEGKLEEYQTRLEKAKMWEEDEHIVDTGYTRLSRSNWKVRSNLTRGGKILFTNKRMIFVRKRFSLFNFNPLTMIPLLAFVRPSNKAILAFKTIYEFIKVPLQVFKGLRPALGNIWVYIAALSVSLPSINFANISLAFDNFFARFPALNFIPLGIDFAIQNPAILPSFAGLFTGLRLGFLKLFMRKEELVVIPYSQLSTLQLERNLLITRLKLKGSSLVRGPEKGIEFKLRLRNLDPEIQNTQFSRGIYSYLLDNMHNESMDPSPPD